MLAVHARAEKYRDKFEAAVATRARLPVVQQQRIRLLLDDINDTDLVSLLESSLEAASASEGTAASKQAGCLAEMSTRPATGGQSNGLKKEAPQTRRAFENLLIFCNNVAFNAGTIHR